MEGWTLESRHREFQQQSFSQSSQTRTTTRVFEQRHHHLLNNHHRVTSNLFQQQHHLQHQGRVSNFEMSEGEWTSMDGRSSSVLNSHSDLLQKRLAALTTMDGDSSSSSTSTSGSISTSAATPGMGGPLMPNLRSLMNGSSSLDSAEILAQATKGFSLSTSTTAVRSEQRQMFAATRSTTLQQSQSEHAAMIQQQGLSAATSTSTSTSTSPFPSFHMGPLLSSPNMNMNMLNMQASQTTQFSASATMGVTRSFSSSSGFPPSSSSTLFSGSEKNASTDSAIQSSAGDLVPALESFVSPFRRAPFNFRNFDRPLWTDMRDNRMTWDPAMVLKTSASQIQFSASQQTFLQASSNLSNGQCQIRAFKDQRLLLRQSYGASESESDNDDDDDDDDFQTMKSITFREKPALPYQPKLAIMAKPHYAPSEDDDQISIIAPSETETESTSNRESGVTIEELPVTPEHKKCWKVAQELLTTERTYVRILHLLDQVFHFRVDQENRVQTMFTPEIITQMFCNIKSLYRLHHDHLLPKLEERLANWDFDPRVGDIMKDFAPFLKMYSEYVQNFDNSINLINLYREKNVRFMNIINEIQKMEECGNLPIQHHLIGPIQRIPRYRLLLEAYIRRLPDDSEDRPDTEKALEIVSKAAEHANEAMRRIASFKKLLEVQENVKGIVDLVSPTRNLVKEGKLSKISARTGDHQERYVFLFSDVILLCSVRPMANRMISNAPYQLRARLDVASVTVAEGDDLEVANTFYVEDCNKKIEFYTSTPDEKEQWMTSIHNAKEELIERKSSLRLGSISPTEDELGLKEPTKLKSDSVNKCMECYLSFGIIRRRHHCHACGSVVCGKCSDFKMPLPYAGGVCKRVCKRCRSVLLDKVAQSKKADSSPDEGPITPDDIMEKMRGVLDVPAKVPAVLSGHLSLRLRGRKEWTHRWFALRTDFVLYCYEKETDERAMTATPIPGMSIVMIEELSKGETPSVSSNEKDRVFRIAHGHGRKSFVFLGPNRAESLNWVSYLKQASKAEFPNNNNPESKSPFKPPTSNNQP